MQVTIELTDNDLRILAGDINENFSGAFETPESIVRWIEQNPSRVRDILYDGVLDALSGD